MREDWRSDPKVWASVVVALVLWASAFAGIRAGMRIDSGGAIGPGGIGPGELALLRFATASAVFAVFAVASRMPLPRKADLPYLAACGFIGISVYHVALNFGEMRVASAAAAVIIASSPIFTALLARTYLKERVTLAKAAGIGLAFAGVLAIAFGESGSLSFEPASLLILLAAVAYAVFAVMGKRPLAVYSSLQFTAVSVWFGTVPLLVFAPGLVRALAHATPSAVWSGVYLGVFPGAIAYVLWTYALKRMPVTSLAVFLNAQPVNAAVIAWLWMGEVPSALTVVGGAVALLGVVLVQFTGAREASVVEEVA